MNGGEVLVKLCFPVGRAAFCFGWHLLNRDGGYESREQSASRRAG